MRQVTVRLTCTGFVVDLVSDTPIPKETRTGLPCRKWIMLMVDRYEPTSGYRYSFHVPRAVCPLDLDELTKRYQDFFDVEEFPEITFEATHVEAVDEDSSRVLGNLTMHGVTHQIKLEVAIQGTDVDPWGNTRAGLEVVGQLKRSDFDMKFNQALGSGNMLVGDKVGIALDISAVLES